MNTQTIQDIASHLDGVITEGTMWSVIKVLRKLEPFIPKWVSGKPDIPGEYLVKAKNVDGGYSFTGAKFDGSDFYLPRITGRIKLEVIAYQPLPSTAHPYEQLLEQLKHK